MLAVQRLQLQIRGQRQDPAHRDLPMAMVVWGGSYDGLSRGYGLISKATMEEQPFRYL